MMTLYERQQARRQKRRIQIAGRVALAIFLFLVFFCCVMYLSTESSKEEEKLSPDDVYAITQEQLPIIRGIPDDVTAVDATRDSVGAGRKKTDPDEYFVRMSKKLPDVAASDTPKEDAKDDEFELLCRVVMAEGGYTEPDKGIRYMADGILNRVESELFPNTITEVVCQKNPTQFACVPTGRIWKYTPTDRVIRICAEEMQERMDTKVLYWKTNGYHPGTSPIEHVGAHYYSGR